MRRRRLAVAGLVLTLGAAGLASARAAEVAPRAAVAMSDQHTSGTAVIVDAARLPEGGFIVIHDGPVNNTSRSDSILGVSSRLSAGYHSEVPISLERAINETRVVTAMLHKDTDDNRIFGGDERPGPDGPYTHEGEPVTDMATVGPRPSEEGSTFGADLWVPLASGTAAAGLALFAWSRWLR